MRTLIAEDDPNQAELFSRFLQPISSKVVICYDPKDAIERLDTEDFDLITFDLNYAPSATSQGMSATESLPLIKRIKEKKPKCMVIIVTGYYDPSMERLITDVGADGIIKKSRETSTPEGFIGAIKSIVESIKTLPEHLQQIETLEKASQRIAQYYENHALPA